MVHCVFTRARLSQVPSVLSTQVSAQQNLDIENRDQRLARVIWRMLRKAGIRSAAETERRRANRRNSRAFSQRPQIAKTAHSGWLGRQDSNLEMLIWKRPFEMSGGFRLISEHIATRDFSRARCRKCKKHPRGAPAPASQTRTGLRHWIGEIGPRKCLSC